MSFERSNIARMAGYTPGEQLTGDDVIKLNTNENPYPPSPAVAAALQATDVAALRRYPPPTATAFREAAANLHEVLPQNLIPTNGGDELLRLVLTTFVDAGETVVTTQPSYSLYPVLADIQDCRLLEVPLLDDWSLPTGFVEQLNASGSKLCILVNPHAPTGQLLSVDQLTAIADGFDGILLVDEAYVDFIDPQLAYNSVPMAVERNNVLLLRTLSKGYSLAGLRFGYGIGCPELIEPMLAKTRDSYNTDLIAQRLATAAIESVDYAEESWSRVRQQREQLTAALQALGFSVTPSQTNFLLCQVPDQQTAPGLYDALKEQNILVRYFDQDRLRDKLRISIGSEEENTALLHALRALL
ncbi:MAG: histidinol-phosphate transaminase [Pseudomonadales bacterium]|nr:histidinol-phosphate transaminase [Pseudomonadales bacterium]